MCIPVLSQSKVSLLFYHLRLIICLKKKFEDTKRVITVLRIIFFFSSFSLGHCIVCPSSYPYYLYIVGDKNCENQNNHILVIV